MLVTRMILEWTATEGQKRIDWQREGRGPVVLEDHPVSARSTTGLSGPDALLQVDATLADVHLVNDHSKHYVGRPILYVLTDLHSRLIVGFHIAH
jgi:hypothetical protein